MSSSVAMSSYSGGSQLVDRLIGDAYPVVKNVYDNMDFVKAVGAAVKSSAIGSPFLADRRVLAQSATGALGTSTIVSFEDLDIADAISKIIFSSVKIIGNDGALYFADSNTYTTKITNLGLTFTLKSDAPSACANAVLQWFLIYGE